MKLLRLKLGVDFRSLAAGFEVHFLREWDHARCFEFHPYCLAGRNGSGKSNVLEVLAPWIEGLALGSPVTLALREDEIEIF